MSAKILLCFSSVVGLRGKVVSKSLMNKFAAELEKKYIFLFPLVIYKKAISLEETCFLKNSVSKTNLFILSSETEYTRDQETKIKRQQIFPTSEKTLSKLLIILSEFFMNLVNFRIRLLHNLLNYMS